MALSHEEKKSRHRAAALKWRNANLEKARANSHAWRNANLERVRLSARGKYASAPEKYAAQKRARYAADPQKHMQTTRKSNAVNLEKRMLLNAKYRGAECTITLEDVVIPELCPVYGIPLDRFAPARAPNKPSLDRVDNTKGYVPGNVRVISWKANSDKKDLSVDQLLALAEYVINHQNGGR